VNKKRGKFITFEGCEGVGKSAQIRMLAAYLTAHGVTPVLTREPGGTALSEKIRALILSKTNKPDALCEALLYAAARANHVKTVIKPALLKGQIVICDRFTDSTLAYQAYARGLNPDGITMLNDLASDGCTPDATVFLDLPPDEAFRRKGGADIADRMENESRAFHFAVYRGYKALAVKYPSRIITVDAGGSKQRTHDKVLRALSGLLGV
jgi:dTMP kinase